MKTVYLVGTLLPVYFIVVATGVPAYADKAGDEAERVRWTQMAKRSRGAKQAAVSRAD